MQSFRFSEPRSRFWLRFRILRLIRVSFLKKNKSVKTTTGMQWRMQGMIFSNASVPRQLEQTWSKFETNTLHLWDDSNSVGARNIEVPQRDMELGCMGWELGSVARRNWKSFTNQKLKALKVECENGEFSISAVRRTKALEIVMTVDHGWAENCKAAALEVRGSPSGWDSRILQ